MLNRVFGVTLLIITVFLILLPTSRPAAADTIFPIPYRAGDELRAINSMDELRALVTPVNDWLRGLDARFQNVHDIFGATRLNGDLETNLRGMTKIARGTFVASYYYLEKQRTLRTIATAYDYVALLGAHKANQASYEQAAVTTLVAYSQQQLASLPAAAAPVPPPPAVNTPPSRPQTAATPAPQQGKLSTDRPAPSVDDPDKNHQIAQLQASLSALQAENQMLQRDKDQLSQTLDQTRTDLRQLQNAAENNTRPWLEIKLPAQTQSTGSVEPTVAPTPTAETVPPDQIPVAPADTNWGTVGWCLIIVLVGCITCGLIVAGRRSEKLLDLEEEVLTYKHHVQQATTIAEDKTKQVEQIGKAYRDLEAKKQTLEKQLETLEKGVSSTRQALQHYVMVPAEGSDFSASMHSYANVVRAQVENSFQNDLEHYKRTHATQHEDEQREVAAMREELKELRPLKPLAESFGRLAETTRAPVMVPVLNTMIDVLAADYASPEQRARLANVLGEQEVYCDQITRRDGAPKPIRDLPRQPKKIKNIFREDFWHGNVA